jgi:hypothetical protein
MFNWGHHQIRNHHRLLAAILLGLVVVLSICNATGVFAQTDQSSRKVQEAKISFEQAFNAVLDAEAAGANVTSLVAQLNSAGDLLAQAENAIRVGDNALATANADSVMGIAQQVRVAAQTAKESALLKGQNASLTQSVLAIAGSIVFVLVMFMGWRLFKRRYIRRMLEAKPEVINQ